MEGLGLSAKGSAWVPEQLLAEEAVHQGGNCGYFLIERKVAGI